MSWHLKGQQSCSLPNFEGFNLLNKNGVLRDFQIWHPVSLMPHEVQGHAVHFWKNLIYIGLEPN